MTDSLARRRADRHGRLAEAAAAWLLRLKGYRILARRVRTPMGEIDLVARRGRTTAFVEVKTRRRREDGLAAVSGRQAARIVQAARYWIARHPALLEGDCRFDIVVISPYLWPLHLPSAFDADQA